MLKDRAPRFAHTALCAPSIALLLVCGAQAADIPSSSASVAAAASAAASQPRRSPYAPDRFAGRAGLYYAAVWGIDSLNVKLVESGQLVRFSYRVVDPAKMVKPYVATGPTATAAG